MIYPYCRRIFRPRGKYKALAKMHIANCSKKPK